MFCSIKLNKASFSSQKSWHLKPHTFKQSNTPAVVEVLMDPPLIFVLRYSKKISTLLDSLLCAVQDGVHTMSCDASGGLWRYLKWSPRGPPPWNLLKIRNYQITAEIDHFFTGKSEKFFFSKRLDHMLALTPNLVTTTTDFHQNLP